MPIYEYECETCHKHVELLVDGDGVLECPACGGSKLVKQFSVPASPRGQSSKLPFMSGGGG
jgi:putative FmdB family regulatory protein